MSNSAQTQSFKIHSKNVEKGKNYSDVEIEMRNDNSQIISSSNSLNNLGFSQQLDIEKFSSMGKQQDGMNSFEKEQNQKAQTQTHNEKSNYTTMSFKQIKTHKTVELMKQQNLSPPKVRNEFTFEELYTQTILNNSQNELNNDRLHLLFNKREGATAKILFQIFWNIVIKCFSLNTNKGSFQRKINAKVLLIFKNIVVRGNGYIDDIIINKLFTLLDKVDPEQIGLNRYLKITSSLMLKNIKRSHIFIKKTQNILEDSIHTKIESFLRRNDTFRTKFNFILNDILISYFRYEDKIELYLLLAVDILKSNIFKFNDLERFLTIAQYGLFKIIRKQSNMINHILELCIKYFQHFKSIQIEKNELIEQKMLLKYIKYAVEMSISLADALNQYTVINNHKVSSQDVISCLNVVTKLQQINELLMQEKQKSRNIYRIQFQILQSLYSWVMAVPQSFENPQLNKIVINLCQDILDKNQEQKYLPQMQLLYKSIFINQGKILIYQDTQLTQTLILPNNQWIINNHSNSEIFSIGSDTLIIFQLILDQNYKFQNQNIMVRNPQGLFMWEGSVMEYNSDDIDYVECNIENIIGSQNEVENYSSMFREIDLKKDKLEVKELDEQLISKQQEFQKQLQESQENSEYQYFQLYQLFSDQRQHDLKSYNDNENENEENIEKITQRTQSFQLEQDFEQIDLKRQLSRLQLLLNNQNQIQKIRNCNDLWKDLEQLDQRSEKNSIFIKFLYIDNLYEERISRKEKKKSDQNYQVFFQFFETLGQNLVQMIDNPKLKHIYQLEQKIKNLKKNISTNHSEVLYSSTALYDIFYTHQNGLSDFSLEINKDQEQIFVFWVSRTQYENDPKIPNFFKQIIKFQVKYIEYQAKIVMVSTIEEKNKYEVQIFQFVNGKSNDSNIDFESQYQSKNLIQHIHCGPIISGQILSLEELQVLLPCTILSIQRQIFIRSTNKVKYLQGMLERNDILEKIIKKYKITDTNTIPQQINPILNQINLHPQNLKAIPELKSFI